MSSKDFEHIIGSNTPSQKLLNEETEKKIEKERHTKKKQKSDAECDISKLSEEEMFSPRAIWRLVHLKTYVEHDISGINALFHLNHLPNVREMLVAGEIDGFKKDDYYIKFLKYRR